MHKLHEAVMTSLAHFDQVTSLIELPLGSFKRSGFGRDRAPHALYKYAGLNSASITMR
jgi:hypothetical protein